MSASTRAEASPVASIEADYPAWVRQYDMLDDLDRATIRADIPGIADPPVISLLLPAGFMPPGLLRDTLASVCGQLYPHWELYVAGDAASPLELAEFAAYDPRIRIVDRERHADIAAAANAALAQADSRFVALLAEGDRLAAHALYEVAVELARHPATGLLYTDEDRVDFGGGRSMPRFKTGWDPDLLLGCDYVGALAVYARALAAGCGGWRAGFGAAAGYDLALRATAGIMPDRVRHLPSVLYHRPAWGAQKLREQMLGPAAEAGRRALTDFLGPAARIAASSLLPSCHRVVWPVPDPAPLVSVIMPTRDRAECLVPAAWGVLLRTDYPNFELLVVDNDSTESITAAALRDLATQPRARVLCHPGPFNYAAINNAAVREARGEVIVLLNNDVDVIHADWLRELVSHALRPDVGAVGARLLYPDGRVQHGGVVLGPGLNAAHMLRLAERGDAGYGGQLAMTRSYSVVTGACLAMRRAVYEEVGGLDAFNFAVAFNDVDLCLRLGEYGYRVVWTPFAELFHMESQSRGKPDTPAKLAREMREVGNLWRLWRHAFDADPFHNPNLACAWDEPLHLCPPRRRKPWQGRTAQPAGVP
jgi:GT2 family glycosyltransferase